MQYSVILLAAGKGTRYNATKQDVLFHNKPLWRYAYETALEIVDKNHIIVVGKDFPGGETRTASVLKGLERLPKNTSRVVIVEAARPMVTKEQIFCLLTDTNPSTSFVRPLVNTVIYRDGRYINRDDLYDLLTPQAFDYKMLLNAYINGKFENMTDETRIMFEFYNIKPQLIETTANLFKVTYPGDLDIVEAIYNEQISKGIRHE